MPHQEKNVRPSAGWLMIVVNLAMYAAAVTLFAGGVRSDAPPRIIAGILTFFASILTSAGFFIVNPNYGALLALIRQKMSAQIANSRGESRRKSPPRKATFGEVAGAPRHPGFKASGDRGSPFRRESEGPVLTDQG